MKNLLIALIALTTTLGVACKKSELPNQETKKELNIKKMANAPVEGGIGGYPGGANTYPHNTGICTCGKYAVCHPVKHNPSCPVSLGTGGCSGCPMSGN